MSPKYGLVVARIEKELQDVERTVTRVLLAWQRFLVTTDDLYKDAAALNMHGFYAALERIFEVVAKDVDHQSRKGANFHQLLLEQMTQPFSSGRPSVIDGWLHQGLKDFLGFRHVVRNVHSYNLDFDLMNTLIIRLPNCASKRATAIG